VGIGAGVALAALLSVVDQGLTHLGEARLSAIVDEAGTRAREAQRVLDGWDSVRARLRVGRLVLLSGAVALAADSAFFGRGAGPTLLLSFAVAVAYGGFTAVVSGMIQRRAARAVLTLSRALRPVEWCFAPLAAPIALLGRSMGRLVPRGASTDPQRLAALAVEHVIDEGEEEGSIAEDQASLLRSVLEFRETVAREVMVPRTQLAAFELSTPIREVVRQVIESGHSRYPVYESSIDQVVGVLYAKDLFTALQDQGGGTVELGDVARSPAFFCPETQTVGGLLREMQAERFHLAIVVDEFGGTSGVLTLEDILEEIVGEIRDEHDDEEAPLEQLEDGRWAADAGTSVYDLEEQLEGFERRPEGEYDSLGGLVVALAGRVPRVGDRLQHEGYEFLIVEGDDRHVQRVEITRAHTDPSATAASQSSA